LGLREILAYRDLVETQAWQALVVILAGLANEVDLEIQESRAALVYRDLSDHLVLMEILDYLDNLADKETLACQV